MDDRIRRLYIGAYKHNIKFICKSDSMADRIGCYLITHILADETEDIWCILGDVDGSLKKKKRK